MLKQDENDFVLLNKAKDLYVYTSEAVGNDQVIPKHRRYTAGQRLETLAIDILLQKSILRRVFNLGVLMLNMETPLNF